MVKQEERRLNSVIATASHELRAPLASIREGIAQVSEGLHGPLTEHQASVLATTLHEIDRLNRYLNDLLDVARLHEKRDHLDWEKVDLCQITRDVVRTHGPEMDRKGLELVERYPGGGVWLFGDANKLARVVSNIVGNAVKFTPAGKILVTIEDLGDQVNIDIADTGIGISREDVPCLFRRFGQFATASASQSRGSGLGLAICKGIVERHGGSICVDSVPGDGSTFTISLPKKNVRLVLEEGIAQATDETGTDGRSISVAEFRLSSSAHDPDPAEMLSTPDGLTRLIRSGLRRRGDIALPDGRRVLALLPSTAQGNALIVAARIRRIVDEYVQRKFQTGTAPRLECRIVNLPGDVVSTEELLSRVFSDMNSSPVAESCR